MAFGTFSKDWHCVAYLSFVAILFGSTVVLPGSARFQTRQGAGIGLLVTDPLVDKE